MHLSTRRLFGWGEVCKRIIFISLYCSLKQYFILEFMCERVISFHCDVLPFIIPSIFNYSDIPSWNKIFYLRKNIFSILTRVCEKFLNIQTSTCVTKQLKSFIISLNNMVALIFWAALNIQKCPNLTTLFDIDFSRVPPKVKCQYLHCIYM